jgi:hypothetical protein
MRAHRAPDFALVQPALTLNLVAADDAEIQHPNQHVARLSCCAQVVPVKTRLPETSVDASRAVLSEKRALGLNAFEVVVGYPVNVRADWFGHQFFDPARR